MKEKIVFIVIVVLLFFSADSLSANIFGIELAILLNQVMYLGVIVLLLTNFKNYNQSATSNIILAALAFFILLTAITNQDYTLGYIIQLIVFCSGFLIAKKIKFSVFVNIYSKSLYLLSITSLVLFTAFIIFPFLLDFFPMITNSEESSYINVFVYVHFINMFRNTGIFREPGMHMIYLNIAILFQYFFYKTVKKKYLIVFIVTLVTTLSTGGFIVFALLAFTYLIKQKKTKTAIQFVTGSSILYLFIIYNFDLFEVTFSKFNSDSSEYGSSVARLSSVTVPTRIFVEDPFFGVGLTSYKGYYEFYSREILGFAMKADGHSTNTLFNSLGTYGFFFFMLLLIPVYKFSASLASSVLVKILIFVSFVMMLGNEDMRYSLLFAVLIFYGFRKYETE